MQEKGLFFELDLILENISLPILCVAQKQMCDGHTDRGVQERLPWSVLNTQKKKKIYIY